MTCWIRPGPEFLPVRLMKACVQVLPIAATGRRLFSRSDHASRPGVSPLDVAGSSPIPHAAKWAVQSGPLQQHDGFAIGDAPVQSHGQCVRDVQFDGFDVFAFLGDSTT